MIVDSSLEKIKADSSSTIISLENNNTNYVVVDHYFGRIKTVSLGNDTGYFVVLSENPNLVIPYILNKNNSLMLPEQDPLCKYKELQNKNVSLVGRVFLQGLFENIRNRWVLKDKAKKMTTIESNEQLVGENIEITNDMLQVVKFPNLENSTLDLKKHKDGKDNKLLERVEVGPNNNIDLDPFSHNYVDNNVNTTVSCPTIISNGPLKTLHISNNTDIKIDNLEISDALGFVSCVFNKDINMKAPTVKIDKCRFIAKNVCIDASNKVSLYTSYLVNKDNNIYLKRVNTPELMISNSVNREDASIYIETAENVRTIDIESPDNKDFPLHIKKLVVSPDTDTLFLKSNALHTIRKEGSVVCVIVDEIDTQGRDIKFVASSDKIKMKVGDYILRNKLSIYKSIELEKKLIARAEKVEKRINGAK